MKKILYFLRLHIQLLALSVAIVCSMTVYSCSDWDDHYENSNISTAEITIYNGDIVDYMESMAGVSQISALFRQASIYDSIYSDKEYTFIVCSNDVFGDGSTIVDKTKYAKYCVSDMSIAPSKLTDGFGIHTRSGKNIWVYDDNGNTKLDDYNITSIVKTNNGYIYYIDGILPIRQSVYEYFNSLGDEYSLFKALVEKYEENVFDEENSSIIGVDKDGKTLYDSVMTRSNTLMDRYTADGISYWNMRDESFLTTMFIPTNAQIDNAIKNALDSIPVWLNRDATSTDREKFEEWIVKACFSDKRLEKELVNVNAADFSCVGGYQKIIDKQADSTRYISIEPAFWRPKIQTVDVNNQVSLSNGVAYFCTNLKIPNHIVIYRIKSRFYELWNAMTEAQKQQHFRWKHWINPTSNQEAQGSFFISNTIPTILYNVLTAEPDDEAIIDSLHCSVDYDGLFYDEATDKVKEVHLPAGEYYLRMGFVHSLSYSISIYFNDSLLVKDMALIATGSNYHLDRCGASDIPMYGVEVGYPEGYKPNDWLEINENANLYDTDGWTLTTVNLKQSGNFHITVDSYNNAYLYNAESGRQKNNKTQLMMYHWCLRPTTNNY